MGGATSAFGFHLAKAMKLRSVCDISHIFMSLCFYRLYAVFAVYSRDRVGVLSWDIVLLFLSFLQVPCRLRPLFGTAATTISSLCGCFRISSSLRIRYGAGLCLKSLRHFFFQFKAAACSLRRASVCMFRLFCSAIPRSSFFASS